MRWLGRAACVNSGPPSIAFSRLLKKYSTMKTSYGRKRHAWRRSSTEYMCSVICRPEARVRKDHPLRVIRAMVTKSWPNYSGGSKRKRIEECFGWLKTIAHLRKLRQSWSRQSGLDRYLFNQFFSSLLVNYERAGAVATGGSV